MPDASKVMDPVVVSYDWKAEISAIAMAFRSMGVTYTQTLKSDGTFTMYGQKKMSSRQRAIFDKMNAKEMDTVRKRAVGEATKVVKAFQETLNKINALTIVIVKKETQINIEMKKSISQVEAIMSDAAAAYVAVVEKNIKGYLKGKARKKVKIQQSVKHAIKTPLAIAAVPVGIAFSATGFGAPIGVLATMAALQSIKETYNFIKRHRGGLSKLQRQIVNAMAELQSRSDEFAQLAEQAETDPEARKKLGILKSKIGKKEAVAYGFQTFLKVNKSSIGKLDMLLDKYQKKVNELRYRTVKIGKRIDKAEAEIKKLEKKIREREAELKTLPAELASFGLDDKSINKLIAKIQIKNNDAQGKIPELKKVIQMLERSTDHAIDAFFDTEAQLEDWASRLETFKSQRPGSLQHWKKAMKTVDFTVGLGSTALGVGSDIISPAESAIEIGIATVGYIDEASSYVNDTYGEVKNQVSKR